MHGYTPNVTEYTTFRWYDWVEYHDPIPPDKSPIGRWLGPCHNIGQGYCYYILSSDGKVVSRSTILPISPESRASPDMKERMNHHSSNVSSIIGDFTQSTLDKTDYKGETPIDHLFYDDDDGLDDEVIEPQEVDDLGNPVVVPDPDVPENDAAFVENDDEIIGAKIPLPHSGEIHEGTVRKRKRAPDNNLLGTFNPNPALDTRVHEVEFPDGTYQDYYSNTLVENLCAHVDENGMNHAILKCIPDHK